MDNDDKKTPFDAVVDEMVLNSDLNREQLSDALMGLFEHLEERTRKTLNDEGGNSDLALRHAREFLVFAELINFYGTALIAIEDIEEESLPN